MSEDASTLTSSKASDTKMQSMAALCGSHQGGAANLQYTQLLAVVSKSEPSL